MTRIRRRHLHREPSAGRELAHNALGGILVLVGFLMIPLPGPGVLVMLAGWGLLDFPRKREFEDIFWRTGLGRFIEARGLRPAQLEERVIRAVKRKLRERRIRRRLRLRAKKLRRQGTRRRRWGR